MREAIIMLLLLIGMLNEECTIDNTCTVATAAILLKERNREMCGLQSLASLLVYSEITPGY